MRILHTSDLHLGISIANMPLLQDQQFIVEQLVSVAKRQQVDAVLIAGDVFDHAVVNAEAIKIYDSLITELCARMRLRVFLCAGNHDGAARLAAGSELLSRAGLYVAGSIRDGLKKVPADDTDIHLLPFFSIDEVRYLYRDQQVETYGQAMGLLLDEMRAGMDESRRNILIAHCFVTGSKLSESDRSAQVGGSNMVSAELFEGFDYVALGHLHRAQTIGGNIRYSGAPMKLSFGDTQQKTVTVLDTDTMEWEETPIAPLRDMRTVSGNYADVLEMAARDDKREDLIKVVLKDTYAHLEILDTLRQHYPGLLMLEGKSYAENGPGTSLQVEEVSTLTPEEIMLRFYTEYTEGGAPSAEQVAWFRKALEETGRERGPQ